MGLAALPPLAVAVRGAQRKFWVLVRDMWKLIAVILGSKNPSKATNGAPRFLHGPYVCLSRPNSVGPTGPTSAPHCVPTASAASFAEKPATNPHDSRTKMKQGTRMDGHQLQGSASSEDAATNAARRCGDDGLMKESFGTKALGIMRSHKEAYDLVLISDFGYTQAPADHAHAARAHHA